MGQQTEGANWKRGLLRINVDPYNPLERFDKTRTIQSIKWGMEKMQSIKTPQSGDKTNRNGIKPKKNPDDLGPNGTTD